VNLWSNTAIKVTILGVIAKFSFEIHNYPPYLWCIKQSKEKMKTILNILFLALGCVLHAQENPWKNNTEKNPWNASAQPTPLDSCIEVSNRGERPNDQLNVRNPVSASDYTKKGYRETKANGAFLGSMLSCAAGSVFGIIIPAIALSVPNDIENVAGDYLRYENPAASSEQVGDYKKGIRKKRSIRTLTGGAIGTAFNFLILALIFQ
jgi:hypothetical protein